MNSKKCISKSYKLKPQYEYQATKQDFVSLSMFCPNQYFAVASNFMSTYSASSYLTKKFEFW